MGVTWITLARNNCAADVTINNHESGKNVVIKANQYSTSSDIAMTIPWCTSDNDFKNKHYIEVTVGKKSFYIWQDGAYVRYSSQNSYTQNQVAIPGKASVDGARKFYFNPDGSFFLIDCPANDVTSIIFARNNFTENVTIKNNENPEKPGNNVTIDPGASKSKSDINIWIPWCTSVNDYKNNHYIEVTVGKKSFYIWQDGAYVRCSSQNSYTQDQSPIPGYADIKGEKHLCIEPDGNLLLIDDEFAKQELHAYAVKINEIADHTYVYCPDTQKYFDCWGGHVGPDKRFICQGLGDYSKADSYRRPLSWNNTVYPDTAGIGKYAIDGVCHQSTNCFLYSTGVTLDISVRGYIFTVVFFGPYGKDFSNWLTTIYNSTTIPASIPFEVGSLPYKLHQIYPKFKIPLSAEDQNQIIVEETATVIKHYLPDIEVKNFETDQFDVLVKKDQLISEGISGSLLAEKMNNLSMEFQKNISQLIKPEEYERITGLKVGEVVPIIDPDIISKM